MSGQTAPSTEMQVRDCRTVDAQNWDEYVLAHEQGTFFHRHGWAEVLEKGWGHKAHYLLAERGGQICGLLPLGHVRSMLFGNALVSTPFCVYGGILADDQEAADALRSAACKRAEDLKVGHLELRNRYEANCAPESAQWHRKKLHVTFRKTMAEDPDSLLADIPRKQRAMVRKGIKAGLSGEHDDHIERIYQTYSESVRNLGTPVFSKRYFQALKDVFGDDCDVLTIMKDDFLVGSVLSFYFKDEVLPYYGGGVAEARNLKGNDFMYYQLMCDAVEHGARVFDYGRSKEGAGSYSFKKNWGFVPEPLFYEFFLVKSKSVPDVNPNNPKYQMFIKLWRKLPLGVSQFLGPYLSRSLG